MQRNSEKKKGGRKEHDYREDPSKKADIITHLNRFMPLYRFGWAFLLAWVFCVFYTGVVEGYNGGIGGLSTQMRLGEAIFFEGLPVLMSVAMLILIVCGEKHFGSPSERSSLWVVAPLLTAFSTPLLFWSCDDPGIALLIFVVGSLLTGMGSGLMWVMWGEYYACISQEQTEFLAPISAIGAAMLVLLLSAMNGWIALGVVTSFPLLSGLCFFLSWNEEKGRGREAGAPLADRQMLHNSCIIIKDRPLQALRGMGRTGLGVLTACLFVCLEGALWGGQDTGSLAFQTVLILSIIFMALVAFSSTLGPRRISVSALYRWMCPTLVLGFVAVIVFGVEQGGFLASAISIAARFAFCLITQMYFAQYAATGKATAVQSFGLGWILVHLGDFLGLVLFNLAHEGIELTYFDYNQVSAVAIGVFVVIAMFVLSDKKSFVTERDEEKPCIKEGFGENTVGLEDFSKGDDLDSRVCLVAQAHDLTPRETEVLDLLARGRSVPYIRDALFISKETAATHVKHIYAKIEVHSRQELIDLFH